LGAVAFALVVEEGPSGEEGEDEDEEPVGDLEL
jgi:hypothetical protein